MAVGILQNMSCGIMLSLEPLTLMEPRSPSFDGAQKSSHILVSGYLARRADPRLQDETSALKEFGGPNVHAYVNTNTN